MATKVIMPKQGLLMTEGSLTKWLKKEGEKVQAGQPLFEMETDKLTIEIDAPESGTLLKILRDAGDVVAITEIIAIIGEPGEDISAFLEVAKTDISKVAEKTADSSAEAVTADQSGIIAKSSKGGRVFITPRARMISEDKGIDFNNIEGTGPEGLIIEKDVLNYAANAPAVSKVSPLAARVAQQKDVKLSDVSGSGVRGKIMKADIEAAAAAGINKAAAGSRSGKVIPFAGMRKVIADKMTKSLHDMAQANHRMKVDMTEIVRFREKLKADHIKVSYTDILVRIVSKALLDFPILNSSLTSEGILVKDYVNMGLAVAVENGLIVPVIKDVDLMTLDEISTVSAELIDKAQKGKLTPDDYTGGTFTITNLGMFDIDEFTAVINPPESAILAIGKISREPVVEGDNIVIKPIMTLSLTYDHRIIDGAPAAQFLQRVKQILQDPYLLI